MTFPAIMRRPRFESFIGTLPAARVVRQWRDDSVAKVGDRIFCLLDGDPGEVWFKASEMAFTLLTDLPGIRPAPYFARAQWVAVSPASPLSAAEIEAYLTEAHRLVAARLTRKAQTALGLAEWIKAPVRRV